MQSYHNTAHRIAELERENAALSTRLAAYGRSHLGILSGPAIRYELSLLTTPVDLFVFDWRKQNEWNGILGWTPANHYIGQAARADYAGPDQRHRTRAVDLRGQWGGDEVVMAVDAGDGRGLLTRVLRELLVLNAGLSAEHRAKIAEKTGGLISGFCIAAVLIEHTYCALADAERAIDATGTLKTGAITGSRATSGRAGTIVTSLEAS